MYRNKIVEYNVLNTPWPLDDNSVDCCVTSPPYWALRDYGVKGQLGLEKTPEEFMERIVTVFEEVRRVLKPQGTLWLNIGDSYASQSKKRTEKQATAKSTIAGSLVSQYSILEQQSKIVAGLKPKDLVGIPWMLAFALRSAGWYLRQDIIWHKPNPMPESVTDRCTKAHEYLFLLSKSSRYYYDGDSIREAAKNLDDDKRRIAAQTEENKNVPDHLRNGIRPRKIKVPGGWDTAEGSHATIHRTGRTEAEYATDIVLKEGKNKRSVWTVSPEPFPEAHFATFPEALIKPCVLAGCPTGGLILDPFMGAGTTALVSMSHGRDFIGFELNPKYIAIANNRLKSKFGMFYKP